jgi:hypothetical protein
MSGFKYLSSCISALQQGIVIGYTELHYKK